ncbi:SET domain-containing protein [Obba rivulosa]|uniref:SET domain-containing protein n=1 Tax=Obba rivulosa TaxID=1052685 RepID=A0A8E2DKG3_9APHY|nr:SET domain-containing protein [Obba rivulosa]
MEGNPDYPDANPIDVKFTSIPPVALDGTTADDDGVTECILYAGMKDAIFAQPEFPKPVPRPRRQVYRLQEVEGAGLGLVATRKIKAGEIIFAERPLVVSKAAWMGGRKIDDPAYKEKAAWTDSNDLLKFVVNRMDPKRRKAFKALANCHREEGCPPLLGIIRTNGISITEELRMLFPTMPDSPWGAFTAIGEITGRMNHSCCANTFINFGTVSFAIDVTASRDIGVGEEITRSYCDALAPQAVRQASLNPWAFVCSCRACRDPVESDIRRGEIRAVKSTMAKMEDTEQMVNQWIGDDTLPDDYLEEKALKLVGLMEEEGLESLQDYLFCKQMLGFVYAARGFHDKAMKYLREFISEGIPPELRSFISPAATYLIIEESARNAVRVYWKKRRLRGPGSRKT